MKKKVIIAVLCLLGTLGLPFSVLAWPTIHPTGVTYYDPSLACNGYWLDARSSTQVVLSDMNGNIVHTWNVLQNGNARNRLLPNGNLLHLDQIVGTKYVEVSAWDGGAEDSRIVEYDWDNKLVWEYKTPSLAHHDVTKLSNGNYLVICAEYIPKEYQAKIVDKEDQWFWPVVDALPGATGKWKGKKRSQIPQIGDVLYEISPAKKIVWEWHAHEHLDINKYSPIVTGRPDWTHANTCQEVPPNKWYDGGDKRFTPGNIIFNPRNLDEFYIIDKETKAVVWKGNHSLGGGIAHIHEPIMIPKGLPGEGNILLYDNGLFGHQEGHVGLSVIIELDPVTMKIVWSYRDVTSWSKYMGSQSRLPNGNTFISEDYTPLRRYQVNPAGRIVWEWVTKGGDPYWLAGGRTQWYPYDHCPQLQLLPKPQEVAVDLRTLWGEGPAPPLTGFGYGAGGTAVGGGGGGVGGGGAGGGGY